MVQARPLHSGEGEMNDAIDEAYDAWKKADGAARALDREVSGAWQAHECGAGEPPTRDMLREAAWLHHDAREKLAHAIRLLHDAGLIQPSSATVRLTRGRLPPGPGPH